MRVTWFSLVDLRSQRKPLKVTFLLCKSAVQVCVIVNHNMSIYSRLNHKLLVQIGDFLVHKVGGLRAITMD